MTAPSFVDAPVESGTPSAASLAGLWFGLAGAPFAWSAQAVADYALAAHACYPAAVPLRASMVDALPAIVFSVSAFAILLGGAALWTSLRSWRLAGAPPASERAAMLESAPPAGRTRFMALAGIAVSSLFLLGIVLHTLAPLLVRACQ